MNHFLEEYYGKHCEIMMRSHREIYEDVTILSSDVEWLKVLDKKDVVLIRMADIISIRILIA